MLIRFSEHIGEGHRKGCIREIEEMSAIVERKDERSFSVNFLRPRNQPFVVEFLRQEERVGTLRLEETVDD